MDICLLLFSSCTNCVHVVEKLRRICLIKRAYKHCRVYFVVQRFSAYYPRYLSLCLLSNENSKYNFLEKY